MVSAKKERQESSTENRFGALTLSAQQMRKERGK